MNKYLSKEETPTIELSGEMFSINVYGETFEFTPEEMQTIFRNHRALLDRPKYYPIGMVAVSVIVSLVVLYGLFLLFAEIRGM